MSCVIGEVCLLLPSSCVTCRCVDSTMAFVSWNLLSSSVALLINSHTVEYGCRTCVLRFSSLLSLKCIIVPCMALACMDFMSSIRNIMSIPSLRVVSFMNCMILL